MEIKKLFNVHLLALIKNENSYIWDSKSKKPK